MNKMKIMHNGDVKKLALLCALLSIAAGLIGLAGGKLSALICFLVSAVLSLVFLLITVKRIKRISALNDNLQKILFRNEEINLQQYCEGELSVLNDSVYKMTVKLREQAAGLEEDKKELSELIADISHQLKTPLTSMGLLSALAASPDISGEKRKELLNSQTLLIDKMRWLISSLLKLAELDAGAVRFKKEEVSVKALLQKSAEPFLVSMDLKGQEFKINSSDEKTEADILWTIEALSNVIKNCTEHTPEGGLVTADVLENPLYTEIVITDSGEEISEKDLPRLFERFYKGENSSSDSAGIGLALARTIMVSQGGTLTAKNSKQGGAQFTFRFYKHIL